MITEKLLKQYKEYKGDLDAWSRFNKVVSHDDWRLIASLVQNLWLIRQDKAGRELIEKTNQLISENLANQKAIDLLNSLVPKK